METIGPQPGRQTEFLKCGADWLIYGGGAGGGKTYAVLLDPLRAIHLPSFRAVMLRKTNPEINIPGGLWDISQEIYPKFGAVANVTKKEWTFPSGATITLKAYGNECELFKWQGAQADVFYIDEATHCTEKQAFWLSSRNRGQSKVDAYMRLTCNPDVASWIARFISWWIDQKTGYPIPERAGVLRWFCRVSDKIHWADSREELIELFPTIPLKDLRPKSCTFIPATIDDNPALTEANPAYRASLLALSHVERERLLKGNWLISDRDGTEWPAEYFIGIWADDDEWPDAFELSVIAGDPATGKDGGDYSAAVFAGVARGKIWIDSSVKVEPVPEFIASVAALATKLHPHLIGFEDNGFQSLLIPEFERWVKENGLMPWPVVPIENHGHKKEIRIKRLGGYLKNNQLRFRRNPQNELLVQQLMTFPIGDHDDGPDALEMCMRLLNVLATEFNRPTDDRAETLVPM